MIDTECDFDPLPKVMTSRITSADGLHSSYVMITEYTDEEIEFFGFEVKTTVEKIVKKQSHFNRILTKVMSIFTHAKEEKTL